MGRAKPVDNGLGHAAPPTAPRGQKRKIQYDRQESKGHDVVNGKYVSNRRGHKLCPKFQEGTCGDAVGDNRCPHNRGEVHQCNLCLGQNHGSNMCAHKSIPKSDDFAKKFKGKGKGRGKGKGKKGSWNQW